MSDNTTWQDQLKRIWESLEDKPIWGWNEWNDVEKLIKESRKAWTTEWNEITKKLDSVDSYYKKEDTNHESLVRWVDKNFPGSYGMSDKPCSLFGKNRAYTIDNAKQDEASGELKISIYAVFFKKCLNTQTDNLDSLIENTLKESKFFSANGFLRKMIIANNYFEEKYDYACFYAEDKIENLYKQIFPQKQYDKNKFFSQNHEIFEEAKKIVSLQNDNDKDCVKLTMALDVLVLGASFKDFPTESQPNVIFYGAPGTGKTYEVKNMINIVCQGDKNRYEWVQFHPSFSYEDFIEGIKPVGIDEKNVKLELVNGIFKDFCIKAKRALEVYVEDQSKNKTEPIFYFIVDEINRANLSSVFGETLSLLEASYRDDPEKEDFSRNLIKLQYSKLDKKNPYECDENGEAKFGIPKNIRFIGMMNDVDKSIDAFDLALRRRFKWIRKDCNYEAIKEVLIKDGLEEEQITPYIESCKKINGFISDAGNGLHLGKSYEFGHSFFMKIKDYVSKSGENANIIESKNKKALFEEHLSPTLKEYLRSFFTEDEIESKLTDAKNLFVDGTNPK